MDKIETSVAKQCTSEEKLTYFNCLCELNADNPADWRQELNLLLSNNIQNCLFKLNKTESDIKVFDEFLIKLNPDDDSEQWKYICLNFYLLHLIKDFELSVQQISLLKNVIRNLVAIGIASNLHPNLPYFAKLPGENRDCSAIVGPYKRLFGTIYGFCGICNTCPTLKGLITSNYLKWILCGFYQILHCPLKKPSSEVEKGQFVMTEAMYKSLIFERDFLRGSFEKLNSQIHPVLYVRETMMLSSKTSPNWLKRAVSSNLNKVISQPKGLECIARALLDAAHLDDNTESWKALDLIGKIVIDFYKLGNFNENICAQLLGLLKLRDGDCKSIKNFERLFSLCTKLVFKEDENLCEKLLIDKLLEPLLCFTKRETNICENEVITESISQTIRIVRDLIVEDDFNVFLIPVRVLFNSLNVIFHIYSVTFENDNFKELNNNVNNLLAKVLTELNPQVKFSVLDNFLFGFPCTNCLELQGFYFCVKDNELSVNRRDYSVRLGPLDRGKLVGELIKKDSGTKASFFTYLLNCLINREKYFRRDLVNQDLLELESQFVLDEVAERNLVVCKLLSDLAEEKEVQKKIIENPADIVLYICAVFNKSVNDKVHKSSDSEDFHALFLIVMVLQALIEITPKDNLNYYDQVIEHVRVLSQESANDELKKLCKKILSTLLRDFKEESTSNYSNGNFTTNSELDKAIEDICDPLLPVRGHGLMTLTKLIQKKDKNALERKHYIMTIFQENLKNEDSFIYLTAIGGLAAMGDVFPDTILNVLTDEYCDFSQRDLEKNQEIRIKLGEVLVRVTKSLGKTAPKYKAILLNAFLLGTKDDDHLIRASSLSNLGEICRVLGYKLGTSITEVLVCVHAIITTDKAPEARRAAVTVIRQLFVGLEQEMIVFLKDEILPIYRTLKNIYHNDADDVMKLQAQLALEQLNENMRDFIFPNPRLNTQKKVILL